MAHTCVTSAIDAEDATFIEDCTEPSLSIHEESSAAYVAGWLEKKCEEHLIFNEEDELVSTEVSAFISEVSRGSLKIPHQTTFDLCAMWTCLYHQSQTQGLLLQETHDDSASDGGLQ